MVLDEVCGEETYSWWHFSSEQIDPYWIACVLEGVHDQHYDEYTGLRWPRKESELMAAQTNENVGINQTWASPNYPDLARKIVANYFNDQAEKTDQYAMSWQHCYVVFFAYILGGWKAMVSTAVPDGMYYEVTYNKDSGEAYVDAYKKFNNVVVPAEDIERHVVQTR